MKKIAFFIFLCLSFGTLWAQESVKLQNAGNDALNAKDFGKALENYEKALAVWGTLPQDYAMIYNCAICAKNIQDLDKAVKYYDLAYTNNYRAEDALFNKAAIYKFQKKNDEYQKAITEGNTKYPENVKFKGEISQNFFVEAVSHVNGANAILKAAIDKINTKKFKDAKDPGYVAEMDKAKKEFALAVTSLDKSLEFNPANDKAKALKETCEKQIKTL
jgi:tetratricopeptide (TPR) repeat protein